MAKTFRDANGNTHELDTNYHDIYADFNEDIVTDEITGYFVEIDETRFEVDKRTYEAVSAYLKN